MSYRNKYILQYLQNGGGILSGTNLDYENPNQVKNVYEDYDDTDNIYNEKNQLGDKSELIFAQLLKSVKEGKIKQSEYDALYAEWQRLGEPNMNYSGNSLITAFTKMLGTGEMSDGRDRPFTLLTHPNTIWVDGENQDPKELISDITNEFLHVNQADNAGTRLNHLLKGLLTDGVTQRLPGAVPRVASWLTDAVGWDSATDWIDENVEPWFNPYNKTWTMEGGHGVEGNPDHLYLKNLQTNTGVYDQQYIEPNTYGPDMSDHRNPFYPNYVGEIIEKAEEEEVVDDFTKDNPHEYGTNEYWEWKKRKRQNTLYDKRYGGILPRKQPGGPYDDLSNPIDPAGGLGQSLQYPNINQNISNFQKIQEKNKKAQDLFDSFPDDLNLGPHQNEMDPGMYDENMNIYSSDWQNDPNVQLHEEQTSDNYDLDGDGKLTDREVWESNKDGVQQKYNSFEEYQQAASDYRNKDDDSSEDGAGDDDVDNDGIDDTEEPADGKVVCQQCDPASSAPISQMFDGPECPAGWEAESDIDPCSGMKKEEDASTEIEDFEKVKPGWHSPDIYSIHPGLDETALGALAGWVHGAGVDFGLWDPGFKRGEVVEEEVQTKELEDEAKDNELSDLENVDGNNEEENLNDSSQDIDENEVIDEGEGSFDEAFAKNRELLGPGKTFTWNGKSYTTWYEGEEEASTGNDGNGDGNGDGDGDGDGDGITPSDNIAQYNESMTELWNDPNGDSVFWNDEQRADHKSRHFNEDGTPKTQEQKDIETAKREEENRKYEYYDEEEGQYYTNHPNMYDDKDQLLPKYQYPGWDEQKFGGSTLPQAQEKGEIDANFLNYGDCKGGGCKEKNNLGFGASLFAGIEGTDLENALLQTGLKTNVDLRGNKGFGANVSGEGGIQDKVSNIADRNINLKPFYSGKLNVGYSSPTPVIFGNDQYAPEYEGFNIGGFGEYDSNTGSTVGLEGGWGPLNLQGGYNLNTNSPFFGAGVNIKLRDGRELPKAQSGIDKSDYSQQIRLMEMQNNPDNPIISNNVTTNNNINSENLYKGMNLPILLGSEGSNMFDNIDFENTSTNNSDINESQNVSSSGDIFGGSGNVNFDHSNRKEQWRNFTDNFRSKNNKKSSKNQNVNQNVNNENVNNIPDLTPEGGWPNDIVADNLGLDTNFSNIEDGSNTSDFNYQPFDSSQSEPIQNAIIGADGNIIDTGNQNATLNMEDSNIINNNGEQGNPFNTGAGTDDETPIEFTELELEDEEEVGECLCNPELDEDDPNCPEFPDCNPVTGDFPDADGDGIPDSIDADSAAGDDVATVEGCPCEDGTMKPECCAEEDETEETEEKKKKRKLDEDQHRNPFRAAVQAGQKGKFIARQFADNKIQRARVNRTTSDYLYGDDATYATNQGVGRPDGNVTEFYGKYGVEVDDDILGQLIAAGADIEIL